jgi:phosphoglycerate dehydrogenase-like enzyme
VIVTPHFRRMTEIFSERDRARLDELAHVVWGRDEPMPSAAFEAALPATAAVVFGTWTFGPDALLRAEHGLRAILEVAGSLRHDDLDTGWCLEHAVAVGSCAPAFGPVVAEMALALTLAASRDIVGGDRRFRRTTERYLHEGCENAVTLFGKTVGFIGCGGLARSLQRLIAPFGVSILGFDPWLNPEELRGRGIEPAGLVNLVEVSDVIYVLAAPTPSNRAMIDRSLLERIRPDTVLVLVSRAHLVDFDALTELVLQGRFRAAIDVFPEEPVPGRPSHSNSGERNLERPPGRGAVRSPPRDRTDGRRRPGGHLERPNATGNAVRHAGAHRPDAEGAGSLKAPSR